MTRNLRVTSCVWFVFCRGCIYQPLGVAPHETEFVDEDHRLGDEPASQGQSPHLPVFERDGSQPLDLPAELQPRGGTERRAERPRGARPNGKRPQPLELRRDAEHQLRRGPRQAPQELADFRESAGGGQERDRREQQGHQHSPRSVSSGAKSSGAAERPQGGTAVAILAIRGAESVGGDRIGTRGAARRQTSDHRIAEEDVGIVLPRTGGGERGGERRIARFHQSEHEHDDAIGFVDAFDQLFQESQQERHRQSGIVDGECRARKEQRYVCWR
jgi:hypothetical protein